jgi:hypothetical protein
MTAWATAAAASCSTLSTSADYAAEASCSANRAQPGSRLGGEGASPHGRRQQAFAARRASESRRGPTEGWAVFAPCDAAVLAQLRVASAGPQARCHKYCVGGIATRRNFHVASFCRNFHVASSEPAESQSPSRNFPSRDSLPPPSHPAAFEPPASPVGRQRRLHSVLPLPSLQQPLR